MNVVSDRSSDWRWASDGAPVTVPVVMFEVESETRPDMDSKTTILRPPSCQTHHGIPLDGPCKRCGLRTSHGVSADAGSAAWLCLSCEQKKTDRESQPLSNLDLGGIVLITIVATALVAMVAVVLLALWLIGATIRLSWLAAAFLFRQARILAVGAPLPKRERTP